MVDTVINAYCNCDHFIEMAIKKWQEKARLKVSPVTICENNLLRSKIKLFKSEWSGRLL